MSTEPRTVRCPTCDALPAVLSVDVERLTRERDEARAERDAMRLVVEAAKELAAVYGARSRDMLDHAIDRWNEQVITAAARVWDACDAWEATK